MLAAIGGMITAFGQIQQGMYQSAVATANAKQAKLNAKLASSVSQQDAEDIGTEALGQMGELLSGQAASGLSMTSPSAVRSRMWMGRVGYKDQLRRIEEGNREYANYRTQANVFRAEAKQAKLGGFLSAAGTLVNTASDIAMQGATGGTAGGGQPPSFLGSAQPSRMSPGYLPVPSIRNRLYSGLGAR